MANPRRNVARLSPPGAGRMRAQQPEPANLLSRPTKTTVHLDDVKLEGDPLELSGNGNDVTVGSNPTAPGQAIGEGYRLLLRNTDALRAALGIDLSDNLWVQSAGKAIYLFTEGTSNPTFQFTSDGRCRIGTSSVAPSSTLEIDGSLELEVALASDIPVTLNVNDCYVRCDAISGNLTVTLPTASGISGRVYGIKRMNAGANTVIVDGNGAETIDGAATKTLGSQYACLMIISNGTNWDIISTFGTVT